VDFFAVSLFLPARKTWLGSPRCLDSDTLPFARHPRRSIAMLFSSSADQLSPDAFKCTIVLDDALLLLWDAFVAAQRQQPPLKIHPLPFQAFVNEDFRKKHFIALLAD
jgi:hypothetical protein